MAAHTVIPSLIPIFVAVAMRRAEERIRKQLVDAGALTPETAIALTPTRSMDSRRLKGLMDGGAVRRTTSGLHYLDEGGWNAYLANRQQRAMVAVGVVLALIAVSAVVFYLVK